METADIIVTREEVQICNTLLVQIERLLNEGYTMESVLKSIHLAGACLMAQIKGDYPEEDEEE